jgi:type I restriction enzyme M protein
MSLNTQNLQPIINFIWTVADDVLINKFLENQYQDVILPMTVLRRLDLALEPTKDKVLKTNEEFKSKIDNLYGLLTSEQHGTGLAFYNTSQFTMKKLLADPKNIDTNFLDYLNGFSENVQDIITKFKFRNQLETFETTGITFSLIEKFCSPKVELSPDKIKFGSTLSEYGFDPDLKFNFMLTNPPYGTSWKQDIDNLNVGSGKKVSIIDKRFNLKIKNFKGELEETCLTSRSNDGQLMFMLHMLSKMKDPKDGGSRIASVHNGSALFTGDAGSGESGIRQYILENDLLECIIQLPNDIFYNTGITTYLWIISNVKEEKRKGKVQLINASSKDFFDRRNKNLGEKKVELTPTHIINIQNLYFEFEENEYSKIYDIAEFGSYQIPVFQPQRDENGIIIRDKKGNPKSDTSLKDVENVPMKEDIQRYFEKEVFPFIPDAWYETDGAKISYEIPFNKYFYDFTALRSLDLISRDIKKLEEETDGLLKEIIE